VGKTTVIREMARVLSDELHKRVVIVDTSNEIGGDGDVPHPAIGGARRMQVPDPSQQHRVMVSTGLLTHCRHAAQTRVCILLHSPTVATTTASTDTTVLAAQGFASLAIISVWWPCSGGGSGEPHA